MQRTTTMAVIVGIFAVVGVLLLFMFSLKATGPSVRSGYTITTEVNDSKGLEIGAEVTRAGVPIGVVKKVSLAEGDRDKVVIVMQVLPNAAIRKDAIATIQLKSLLGTYFIHLSHGTPGSPLVKEGDALKSEELMDINDVMRIVAGMGDQVDGLLASVNSNQKAFFEKINGVIDENRGNVKTVTAALAKSAPKVEGFFDSVGGVADSLNEGKGTLGKLLNDDTVYNDVKATASNLQQITTQVKSGEGTLGKVIYDKKLATQLESTFDNVDAATKSLRTTLESSNESIKGLLDAFQRVTPNLEKSFTNFAEISEKVNKGDGTLGKLVNDPELYNEVRRTVQQIRKTFEEGEEQSVMRTFLGVFFGSMM
jgi:phospholipid/cholesterol/gamma-HCH transport system substrate-binding protein